MSELWEYSGNCTVGERHKRRNMLCQDRMSYKYNGFRQAVSLVDGIGQTDKNTLAGEKVAGYITDYLLHHFVTIMTENPQTIKSLLLKDIYRIIESLMDEFEMPKEEFASTVMGICVDHERKKFCTIHLGDGIILRRDSDWKILSYPMNGFSHNQTYLTISEAALQKMRLLRGNVGDATGYVMMTDGMYDYPIQNGNLQNIIEGREKDVPAEDDKGIVMLRKI